MAVILLKSTGPGIQRRVIAGLLLHSYNACMTSATAKVEETKLLNGRGFLLKVDVCCPKTRHSGFPGACSVWQTVGALGSKQSHPQQGSTAVTLWPLMHTGDSLQSITWERLERGLTTQPAACRSSQLGTRRVENTSLPPVSLVEAAQGTLPLSGEQNTAATSGSFLTCCC